MAVIEIAGEGSTGFPPLAIGDTVVAIPLYGGGSTWELCIESVLRWTDPDVPLFIFEDAHAKDEALEQLASVLERVDENRPVYLHKNATNLGFVENVNLAFSLLTPADVLVLNSDAVVGPGWLRGIQKACENDPSVATVTAMSTYSTIVTVPETSRILEGRLSVENVAALAIQVAEALEPVYPEIPTAVGFCTLFRRHALEIVGDFDPWFSPGYGEEVDFSQRYIMYGLRHVAADNVLVYHKGSETFGQSKEVAARKLRNDEEVNRKYPWFLYRIKQVHEDPNHPLNHSIHQIEIALRGIDIVMDAAAVDPVIAGTYSVTVGLSKALLTNPKVRNLYWATPQRRLHDLRSYAADFMPNVHVVPYSALPGLDADLGFMPSQSFDLPAWQRLSQSSWRRSIWHLDFISYGIPIYAPTMQGWLRSHLAQDTGLIDADGIFFLSHSIENIARSLGRLPDEDRTFLLQAAAEGPVVTEVKPSKRLRALPPQFVLVLGTSYIHKNRAFLASVFEKVQKEFPQLQLVFAGSEPSTGGDRLELKEGAEELGRVSDDERTWLYQNAALVVAPSLSEGFGLTPLEAAKAGTVPLASKTTGHIDLGVKDCLWLDLESESEAAKTIIQLLQSEDVARQQLAAWKSAADNLTWQASADQFLAGAEQLFRMRPRVQEIQLPVEYAPRRAWVVWLYKFINVRLFPLGSKRREIVARTVRKAVVPLIQRPIDPRELEVSSKKLTYTLDHDWVTKDS